MNTALVTTGISALIIGATKTFELAPTNNGLYWNLIGGIVNLLLRDPTGALLPPISATISGTGVTANWTVVGPAGTWTRAWDCTDASGVRDITLPIAFPVEASP